MKKNAFLTFIFACIPGAGQMYYGYMKRGTSLLVYFCLFIMLGAIISPLVVGVAVVYMFSFFDTYDLIRHMAAGEPKEDSLLVLGNYEEIKKLIDVNLMGVNNGCQSAIRRMKKYHHGKIVNTSSFAGRHALEAGFAHYGMTKAGVIYLTQAAAYTGADENINVNAVCPGIIRSQMWETILDSYAKAGQDRETAWRDSLKRFIPLARGDQKAEDIAYGVLFLCSKYADHITGQSLNIDGGAAMN